MKYIYISGIILLIYYFYKKFRHKLRAIDIHKRYCTFGISNKRIHTNKAIELMIQNDLKIKKNFYQFIKIYDINKITSFLNKNFSDIQFFLNKYMDWVCNTPHRHIICISTAPRNNWNIGYTIKNKLIGLLTLRPIIVSCKDKILKTLWVDYNCVVKKRRNRGYGTDLELRAMSEVQKSNFDNIFYIKDIKIVDPAICEIEYFILDLKKIKKVQNNLQIFNPDKIQQSYNLYNELSKKKKLHQIMSMKEFIYYFKPEDDLKYCYISNKTICLVTMMYFKYDEYTCHLPNIALFLTKGNRKTELRKIFTIFKKKKFNNMIINDTFYIKAFKKYSKSQGISYLHGFNYTTKIKTKEIAIPLI